MKPALLLTAGGHCPEWLDDRPELSLEPGWHWSEDIKPLAGTDTCQARHVGFMESGSLHVMMADGAMDIGPGETYVIEPGHDAEVAGNEPVVALEFATQTAEGLPRQAGITTSLRWHKHRSGVAARAVFTSPFRVPNATAQNAVRH